jgi:predicted small secreted protein
MKKTRKTAVLLSISFLLAVSLLMAGCDTGDGTLDGGTTKEKMYRIKNWFAQTYSGEDTFLYDDAGTLRVGPPERVDNTDLWIIEVKNGKKTLKNLTTGNYINMKGKAPAWDADPLVAAFEDDPVFYWEFDETAEESTGSQIFLSGGESWLSIQTSNDVADRAGTVQCRGDIDSSWGSNFWVFYLIE